MTPSLQEAINLARAGQKEEARVMFMQIIQQNPRDETAWLWLADCLPDDPQRIQAFETCLRFNPGSHRARIALDLLLAQTSGSLGDASATELSWAPEQPPQAEPAATYHEKPLPQAGDFEIKGDISADFLRELEEQSLPPEKPAPLPPVAHRETIEEPDEPFVAEPPKPVEEPSTEDQLIQSLRKPKRWRPKLPAFLKGKAGQAGKKANGFRWVIIALLAVIVLLIAASAVMLGLSNLQSSNIPAIRSRSVQPTAPGGNPSQAVQSGSNPMTTQTVMALITPEMSPTPSPSPVPPLPTGQSGASINLQSSQAAALPKPSSQHSATLLPDGRVLIAGGSFPGGAFGFTYFYDPASDTFTQTGSLFSGRYGHSSTVLSDGRVLVAGGKNNDGDLTTSELLDPASRVWTLMPMAFDHGTGHIAILLANGQVLVAGGCTASGPTDAAEIYDPSAKSWNKIAPMPGKRCNASATRLPDGRVLVVGEAQDGVSSSAVIYDSGKLGWTPAAALRTARSSHAATLLPDGRVLVSGGLNSQSGSLNSIEVYDPAKDAWTELAAMHYARFGHAAVLLPDARLLVIGGFDRTGGAPLDTVEVYYPGSNAWSEPAHLSNGLGAFSATVLPEGKVWIAGGTTDGQTNTDATEIVLVMK